MRILYGGTLALRVFRLLGGDVQGFWDLEKDPNLENYTYIMKVTSERKVRIAVDLHPTILASERPK